MNDAWFQLFSTALGGLLAIAAGIGTEIWRNHSASEIKRKEALRNDLYAIQDDVGEFVRFGMVASVVGKQKSDPLEYLDLMIRIDIRATRIGDQELTKRWDLLKLGVQEAITGDDPRFGEGRSFAILHHQFLRRVSDLIAGRARPIPFPHDTVAQQL